jgi:glycosyltransferase involved in cell wall biosynthesis
MRTAVLITNYNNGPWIKACVDSALEQTLLPDEVIVYDDGSTDDSLSLLRAYGKRITLLEGIHDYTRSGRASAAAGLAAAFSASSANHIYLLDGDDTYLPTHFAAYEGVWATRPEAVAVQGPMLMTDGSGQPPVLYHDFFRHDPDILGAIYRSHRTDCFYLTSALAFNRVFLDSAMPLLLRNSLGCSSDNFLFFHALFHGPTLSVTEPQTVYRARPNSLSDQNGLRSRLPIHETRFRNHCFNRIAADYGRAPVQAWRNFTYLQQLARLWLPHWLTLPLAKFKAARRRRKKG